MEKNCDRKLVFLDAEMGGLNEHRHSLLTIGYVITDSLYDILQEREFYLPIDGAVGARGLQISGLDVSNRKPTATVAEIVDILLEDIGDSDATLLGHNIGVDLSFMRRSAFEKVKYQLETGLNRSIIDTKSLLEYLRIKGLFDESSSLRKFLCTPRGEKHGALLDAKYLVDAMKKIDSLFGL